MDWTAGPRVGFDTETTGVDVAHDRIVTAALVLREHGRSEVHTWLIDPGIEIPAEASAIHGVTTARAREHGRPPAAALEEIAALLVGQVRRGVPIVAYNAAFDLSLLDAELTRYGLPTLPERLGREVRPVLDPLVLDRALDRYRPGKRTLGDLVAWYGVLDTGSLHTADVDVFATLDVLDALVRAFPELSERTLDEVHDFQVGAHRRWADSFNAWRSAQGYAGVIASGEWPREKVDISPTALS